MTFNQISVPEGLRDKPFRVNAGGYRTRIEGVFEIRERMYRVSEGFDTLQEALVSFNANQAFLWQELQWVNPVDGLAYDLTCVPVVEGDDEEEEGSDE